MTSKMFSTLCIYFLADNDFFIKLSKQNPSERLSNGLDQLIERFEELEAFLPESIKEQIESYLLLPYKNFISDEETMLK